MRLESILQDFFLSVTAAFANTLIRLKKIVTEEFIESTSREMKRISKGEKNRDGEEKRDASTTLA